MHKSVASYVDKEHRRQATAATCYTRHEGSFLPQYEELISPSFKHDYKEKISYFELTEKISFISGAYQKLCKSLVRRYKSKKNQVILFLYRQKLSLAVCRPVLSALYGCTSSRSVFYFTGKQFPVKKDLFPNFENEVFTMSLLFLKEKWLMSF